MDYQKSAGGVLMPDIELKIGGRFFVEHIRDGKLIDEWDSPNLVVNEGLNHILDVQFNAATQVTTWYIGIFEANYTPVAGVTAATIASASTESTAYDEATRVEYVEANPTSQVVTNTASKATFTINATKTIYGAFLISNSTKGGTSGVLFAASQFGASKAVVDNDQLLITYAITASSV